MARSLDRPETVSATAAVLYLPAEERRRLVRWASEGYPYETCGCLLGSRDGAGVHVQHIRLGRNLNAERARDRYELDPEDLLRAEDEARARGLNVVGIWHSHPDHAAEPSETDSASAWAGWSYVIVSVSSKGVSSVRSWRLSSDLFLEEEIRS
jgi:proteasome lid subunit RPN8/RPN11